MQLKRKIFISCGELSGENHAANLVRELKSKLDCEIYGFGSKILEAEGVTLFEDYKDYSFSGLSEIIPNLNKIFSLRDELAEKVLDLNPDIVILVDYGGFNMKLAKAIKKEQPEMKVVQFIAPQIWASRPWRINNTKKYIDKVFCTLPLEKDLYTSHNIDHEYVGNPILPSLSPPVSKSELGINENSLLLGVFPGSRKAEIKYMLPLMIEAIGELKKKFLDINFDVRLAKAKSISMEVLNQYGFNEQDDIKIFDYEHDNPNHALLSASDCLWLCSGTVTLEAAFYGTPYFLSYKSTNFNYYLYLLLRTIEKAGLANIIAGEYLVKEFIQFDANLENFVSETSSWLESDSPEHFTAYYHQIQNSLNDLKNNFARYDTYSLVAEGITTLLKSLPK